MSDPETYQAQVYDTLDFIPGRNDIENESSRIKLMTEFVRRAPVGHSVLDVGCADGMFLKRLGAYRCYGLDISTKLVAAANENGIEAVVGNIEEALPYESDSFDVVVTGETIEHVVDTDMFLSEISRVLRPGGALVLSCPNVNAIASIPLMLLMDQPPQLSARYRSPHVKDFTCRTLRQALKNNGFVVEELVGTEFYVPPFGPVLAPVARRLPRFAKEIVVFAKQRIYVRPVRGRVEQLLEYGV